MQRKRLRFISCALLTVTLSLCALTAFAEEVGPDIAYLLTLQNIREGADVWLTQLMQLFTLLGEAAVPVFLSAILFWVVDEHAGTRVLFFNSVGTTINQFMKITACVYRPWIRDARITPVPAAMTTATGYSFPSGHVANAGSWLMGLGLFLKDKCAKKGGRIAIAVVSLVLWLLVALSRNFLGVHTPQDVGVMLLVMLPLAFLCEKALTWAEKSGSHELIFSGACILLGAVLVTYASLKSYPMDYDAEGMLLVDPARMIRDTFSSAGMMLGFAIGWLCQRRYIRFERKGSIPLRILRAVVGCAIILGMELLKAPLVNLMGDLWGRLTLVTLEFLFILAGYPLCIRAVQRRRASHTAAA